MNVTISQFKTTHLIHIVNKLINIFEGDIFNSQDDDTLHFLSIYRTLIL